MHMHVHVYISKPHAHIHIQDQLFFDAAQLTPFLIRKVQTWALLSRGMFPISGADGSDSIDFELWEVAVANPELRARVKWARNKTVGQFFGDSSV
jgi:hypothetical protein